MWQKPQKAPHCNMEGTKNQIWIESILDGPVTERIWQGCQPIQTQFVLKLLTNSPAPYSQWELPQPTFICNFLATTDDLSALWRNLLQVMIKLQQSFPGKIYTLMNQMKNPASSENKEAPSGTELWSINRELNNEVVNFSIGFQPDVSRACCHMCSCSPIRKCHFHEAT